MTSVCRQPTPTSGWVLIDIVSRPRYSTFDPDRWTDMAMSNETFCDFFCDHDSWTTLRRMISARILYQHSIGLGVLSPKVNWKCFVKMYIITNPARFHSNPVMKPLAKMIKLLRRALTWQWQKHLFQSNLSCWLTNLDASELTIMFKMVHVSSFTF